MKYNLLMFMANNLVLYEVIKASIAQISGRRNRLALFCLLSAVLVGLNVSMDRRNRQPSHFQFLGVPRVF